MRRWSSSYLAVLLILTAADFALGQSVSGKALEWKLDTRSGLGMHTNGANDLATHRHQLEFEQVSRPSSQWIFKLGARARVEAAYAANPTRYGDLAQKEGQETELREVSGQFRSGGFSAKVGSQTVVWGEAFGAFYADIVNPKDLREAAIGELAEIRRPMEMINLQYVDDTWSIQALYAPFFRSNWLPGYQSDFFPSTLAGRLGTTNIQVDGSPNIDGTQGDAGAKLQARLGAADISIFHFSHIDRQPVFEITSGTPILIKSRHSRTEADGLTLSWANDDTVVRAEVVRFSGRKMNVAPTLADLTAGRLSRAEAAEQWIGVFGVDYPLGGGWNFGVQYSEDVVSGIQPSFRMLREGLLGLQFAKDFDSGRRFSLLGASAVNDGSFMIQSSLMVPRSRNLEMGVEGTFFGGASDSTWGSRAGASRVVFVIKGFFRG